METCSFCNEKVHSAHSKAIEQFGIFMYQFALGVKVLGPQSKISVQGILHFIFITS